MSQKSHETDLDLGDGRDELNLAEFPLSLISKRSDQDTKVLVFEDKIWDSESRTMVTRKVTISGSADCGLPNAADEEVLLALIQITKLQGSGTKRSTFPATICSRFWDGRTTVTTTTASCPPSTLGWG